MIGPDALAGLVIKRVIFHDVPRNIKGQDNAPVLSDIPTPVDGERIEHLKTRIRRALSSRSAYAIEFNPQSPSPIPDLIRKHTLKTQTEVQFVKTSQVMATYLYEQQVGASSPGLLAILDARIGTQHALLILKLEREEGAQLEPSTHGKKKTFNMSVLDNLVLTGGTKLFKNALFLRTGPNEQNFKAIACDNQRSFASTIAMAQFWQKFLGCKLREEPRIVTKNFYEAAVGYINANITDPVEMTDVYEHIVSELKSQKHTLSPKAFIEDYIPAPHRQPFEEHLKAHHVTLQQFTVDTTEIARRLKRRTYYTTKGASVTIPAEEPAVQVLIGDEQITVLDSVETVDTK
jgi:hypothetical protein